VDCWEILEKQDQEEEVLLARLAYMEGLARLDVMVLPDLDRLAHKVFKEILGQPVQIKLVRWEELVEQGHLEILAEQGRLGRLAQLVEQGHKEILGQLAREEILDQLAHMEQLV
jgi:hypothetical protein